MWEGALVYMSLPRYEVHTTPSLRLFTTICRYLIVGTTTNEGTIRGTYYVHMYLHGGVSAVH